MPQIVRTKLGFLWALAAQYEGLQISASMFDVGHQSSESVRMANAMYILIGPPRKSHRSVIAHLKMEEVSIATTAQRLDQPTEGGSPLVAIKALPYVKADGSSGGWIVSAQPNGNESLQSAMLIPTAQWWDQFVLTSLGGRMSRLHIVQIMRDRDGGAHVDSTISDGSYSAALLHGIGYQFKPSATQEARPVEGMIEATIRQMAAEVLYSLESLYRTARFALQNAAKEKPLSQLLFHEQNL